MSTSSTPMFCLLVRAPISSQIKTARLNGHNTSGPLCTLRLFTPYHLIQFVLPCPLLSGPSPAVNVTVPGISSCSLAAYPSLANSASLCFEAENSCGSPFNCGEALSWYAAVVTEARSPLLASLYGLVCGRKRRCARLPALLDVDRVFPPYRVLVGAGSCQRALWLPMTSARHKSRPWFFAQSPSLLSSRR